MRMRALSVMLLTIALVAPTQSARAQGAGQRPFTGSCEITSAQVTSFTFPILNQTSTAVCHLSHLGRVDVVTQQHVNVVTGAQTAEITWTTASGDQIFLTNTGTSTPAGSGILRFSGVTTIIGGTGRFDGATGRLDAEGTVDNATATGSIIYDGWISYDASSHGD